MFLLNHHNWDEETLNQFVDSELAKMTEGKVCSICNGIFANQEQIDNAIYTGCINNEIIFAHEECWNSSNKQII